MGFVLIFFPLANLYLLLKIALNFELMKNDKSQFAKKYSQFCYGLDLKNQSMKIVLLSSIWGFLENLILTLTLVCAKDYGWAQLITITFYIEAKAILFVYF